MAQRPFEPEPPRPGRRQPILCAVLDVAGLGEQPEARARALFCAGVDWIQLRDRTVPAVALFQVASALVRARDAVRRSEAAARTGLRVLVNRRVDVALATGADGVHLGFDALDPRAARSLLGLNEPRALAEAPCIGLSAHSVAEVEAAAADAGACSYVHLAPIWDPLSKPAARPALGLAVLARAAASGVPVLAQGGLDASRAADAIAAGAAGIAVTGLLTSTESPTAVVAALRHALD